MTTTVTDALIVDMTHDEYLAHPALSASGMKQLIDAPAKFHHWRNHAQQTRDYFDFGHAWHARVLHDESKTFETVMKLTVQKESVPADSYDGTKSAKAHCEEIRARGNVPLIESDRRVIEAMGEKFDADPLVQRFMKLDKGSVEQTIIWTDERTGIQCKARLDFVPEYEDHEIGFTVIDGKTAKSARPRTWLSSAPTYGYEIQDEMYRRAVRAAGLSERPSFMFLVQEKVEPYLVTAIRLDPEAQAIGSYLVDKALATYAECDQTGIWPGYATDYVHGSLPSYYTRQFEGLI